MLTLVHVGEGSIESEEWWHARDREDLVRLLRQRVGEFEAAPADLPDRDYYLAEAREIVAAVEAWPDWAAGTHLLPGTYPPLYLLIS
jgi:hypothetical protein